MSGAPPLDVFEHLAGVLGPGETAELVRDGLRLELTWFDADTVGWEEVRIVPWVELREARYPEFIVMEALVKLRTAVRRQRQQQERRSG